MTWRPRAAGGKGTGETRELTSAARGQVLGGPGANFCGPPLALEERRLHVEMGTGGRRPRRCFLSRAGASPNGPSSAAGARGGGFRGRGRLAYRARAAGAPHKARGAGAATALTPGERPEARRRPRVDSGGRPQAFVCWFRAAFLAGWLPVTEVIHSFQNCLRAGAGAESSELLAVTAAPAPISQPFLAGAPAPVKVLPGRDSGRGGGAAVSSGASGF